MPDKYITETESAYIRAKLTELSKKSSDTKITSEKGIVAAITRQNEILQRLLELEGFVIAFTKINAVHPLANHPLILRHRKAYEREQARKVKPLSDYEDNNGHTKP